MCILRYVKSCDVETKKHTLDLLTFCKKIEPYVEYKSYNDTAHHILKNEIDLILLQLHAKQKCGIITTLVSSFIGLAYEGISSFLHNRRHKALCKTVKAKDSKMTIQHNKIMYLEYSMVMYGIYNTGTLEQLIKNTTSTFITLHHLMKNCLQDSEAQQHFNPYMQRHKAYNITQ